MFQWRAYSFFRSHDEIFITWKETAQQLSTECRFCSNNATLCCGSGYIDCNIPFPIRTLCRTYSLVNERNSKFPSSTGTVLLCYIRSLGICRLCLYSSIRTLRRQLNQLAYCLLWNSSHTITANVYIEWLGSRIRYTFNRTHACLECLVLQQFSLVYDVSSSCYEWLCFCCRSELPNRNKFSHYRFLVTSYLIYYIFCVPFRNRNFTPYFWNAFQSSILSELFFLFFATPKVF